MLTTPTFKPGNAYYNRVSWRSPCCQGVHHLEPERPWKLLVWKQQGLRAYANSACLLPQVKQRLQTMDRQITVLCAREQAGQPMEVHFPGLNAVSSSECCAYEHKQCVWAATSAPAAGYMQRLIASMSATSSAAAMDGTGQAMSELTHQLYEWIGGASCSLQGV